MNTTEPVRAPYTPTTTQPVTIATSVNTMHFGEDTVSMFCPYCQQGIITKPNYTPVRRSGTTNDDHGFPRIQPSNANESKQLWWLPRRSKPPYPIALYRVEPVFCIQG
ncbi:hypothetical protein AC249_AIPGENE1818 [Exaiptasia diaphana]|nr:hypothetical protein AC249_AIPGENE1818 [Exaiptasia diaphana]